MAVIEMRFGQGQCSLGDLRVAIDEIAKGIDGLAETAKNTAELYFILAGLFSKLHCKAGQHTWTRRGECSLCGAKWRPRWAKNLPEHERAAAGWRLRGGQVEQ